MHSILVRAKLHRPTPTLPTIPRPHLLQRLHNGLRGKVTLISAPAGFGKSTVVSAWLDELVARTPDSSNRPTYLVSWLALEAADNQLARFARYLVAAVEESFPQSCQEVRLLLQDWSLPTVEALADTLVESLSHLPGSLLIVLDDLHLLDDEAIFAFLAHLILHSSNQLHLVLITRVDPPFPLNRWRAQGHLNELRLHDLSFTLAEAKSFLSTNLDQTPGDEIVAMLHERTEGWVVGLRLVALALAGATDYEAIVAGFQANSNRYIIDYLVDDVLDQQPPGVQQFLICTSILARFSPALCAAVMEIDKNAVQQHISYLARTNLFLFELSSPAHWYRYHHQFQSMLLSRLYERYDLQAIATLRRNAAAWLAAHDQVDEALRHLIAIPDFMAAADLIESQRVAALNQQRFHELDGWLTLLPAYLLNQRPALLISLAWVQNYWLNDAHSLASIERAEELLQEQQPTLSEVTLKLLKTELYALRIAQDRPLERERALLQIRQHWLQIRPYLSYTHWSTVVTLAHTGHFLGGGELSCEMLANTFERTTEWPQMARTRILYSLGILHWYNCNLAQAERIFQQGLHLARQFHIHLAILLCNFGLALIASQRNQHEVAETSYLEVVKEPHYQNGLRAVMSVYNLFRIYVQRGQPEEGRSLVVHLKNHAVMIGRPYLLNQVEALEAYHALIRGDLAPALRWALAASNSGMYRPEDRIPLIRTQILMAEASPASLQKATQLLESMIRDHERENRWSLWIETQSLVALAWAKSDHPDRALAALGSAVQRAVPNGVVGPFVENGRPMEELLHLLGQQPEYAQPVQLLLAAFPGRRAPAPTAAIPVKQLPEPLTEREIDILKLLAGRLSNKEIAHELIVSIHTVRNHTANIFGKLHVDNRLQAVERARELGILPNDPRFPVTGRPPAP